MPTPADFVPLTPDSKDGLRVSRNLISSLSGSCALGSRDGFRCLALGFAPLGLHLGFYFFVLNSNVGNSLVELLISAIRPDFSFIM